jgi:hypothetical protein
MIEEKEIIWEYHNNFDKYLDQNEDDMREFHGLKKKRTGLSVNICVDDKQSYKGHNHPLWVYVQNDYSDTWNNNEFLPISVSNNPMLLANKEVKISYFDLYKVFKYIQINRVILKKLADSKINEVDFLWEMDVNRLDLEKSFKKIPPTLENIYLPTEKRTDSEISTQYTGRLRFQLNENLIVSISLDDLTVIGLPENIPENAVIDEKGIEQVKKFVFYNKENLRKLAAEDGSYYYETFLRDMIKVDENGIPLYTQKKKKLRLDFKEIKKKNKYDLTIVMSSHDRLYNFINDKQVPISEVWFNYVEDFKKQKNGKVAAEVEIDKLPHYLYLNGEIEII